ncbi:MAG: hypothetical protein WBI07_06245 [Mobilitalea sp.]
MKKILVMIMAVMMVVSLAACGNSTATDTSDTAATAAPAATTAPVATEAAATDTAVATTVTPGSYPAEKVIIGVEIYDPTDSEFLEMQKYFDYLAETINVEFKYSEAIKDADGEMKFIEDCAMAGCKGFIAYYNVSGVEQVRTVIEYDMYYWGMAATKEVYDAYSSDPMYLGDVNTGNSDYEAGKAIGEWVLAQGFDTVVYANGGADFGVAQFVSRQAGFTDALKDSTVNVITVSGFPGDQFFADQAAALGTEGLDAVCASFNGLDFWAQPIASAGLDKTVKLATVGSLNQNYVDAFGNGSVSFLAAANIQRFGLAIGMICNAVDGNADALKADGLATNVNEDMWTFDNAEDCAALFAIQANEKIFSVEDVLSLCKTINPSTSATTITDLVESSKLENLLK